MRQRLTKFFYSELLRMSKYRYSVVLYYNGNVIGVGENAYVEVVECKISTTNGREIHEFPGHTEINVDMPSVMNEGGPIRFVDDFFDAFQKHHLVIRYADFDDLDNFKEYTLIPTWFELPMSDAILQNPLFIKFNGVIQPAL
jgi:hypothetical protein